MILWIRHISLCLWVSMVVTVPLVFLVSSRPTGVFENLSVCFLSAVFLSVVYLISTFVFHSIGVHLISNLLKAGYIWEQAGIEYRASKKYMHAIRIFDSFLICPILQRRIRFKILYALTRLYLSGNIQGPEFAKAASLYLKTNPMDEELVRIWLEKFSFQNTDTSSDQKDMEVLTVLIEHHHTNSRLAPFIAKVLLTQNMTDYASVKFYRRILALPELEQELKQKIEKILNRTDKTLRHIEVKSKNDIYIGQNQGKDDSLNFRQDRGSNIEIVRNLSENFRLLPKKGTKIIILRIWKKFSNIISFLIEYFSILKRGYWLLIILLFAGVVFLVILLNFDIFFQSSRKLHQSSLSQGENTTTANLPISKPYTIQVAAFLKLPHAQTHAESLKKQSIDARIINFKGGGKIWYLVRVSEFSDKESAELYGEKLKAEKLIDDFFVCNK